MNITELEQNIGKRCKVIESPIAGLTGREATIKGVSGDQREGFRYHIELDEPLFSFLTKTDYYPPVFLVEIL
jgi:hypothetical protein